MTTRQPDAPRAPLDDPAFDAAWRAASQEVPPPALDATILAAARRAVDAGPRRVRDATRPERWWWPLAAAATIGAIAVGILQLGTPGSEPAIVTDMPAGPPAAPASTPPAAPPAAPTIASAAAPPAATTPARADDAARDEATARAGSTAKRETAGTGAAASSVPAPSALGKLAAGSAAEAGPAAGAQPRAPLPVADWIALIRKLRAEGRIDEAATELAAFRRAHQDGERLLPEDLRDWRPAEK